MMQRILQVTQDAIAAAPQLGSTSYAALILRASADDLVRYFDLAIKEAMDEVQRASKGPAFAASGLMGLSIEPLDPSEADAESDFLSSVVAYERLSAKAKDVGARGLSACSKKVVLGSFDEAFRKSQIAPAETRTIMPLARRALNNELEKLYAKLEAL